MYSHLLSRLGRRTTTLMAMAGLALLAPVDSAVAQEGMQTRVMVTEGGMGGMGMRTSRLSNRNVDRYSEVLSLTAEQRDVARLLFEGYNEAYQGLANERRERTQAIMRSFQDTQDHTLLAEKMPEIQREFGERTERLEKDFFGDLRAILTSEQDAKFDRVDRLRRREVGVTRATLSGEGVDLTDIVSALSIPSDAAQSLAEPIEQYELAMDRALKERADVFEEAFGGLNRGSPTTIGPEALERMAEMREKTREASARVRDINRQYARLIESQLPAELAAKFADEVKRRSFSQVYREPHIVKSLGAAKGFSDLTSDQRKTIEELTASYAREAAAINDRWATAVREHEESGSTGAMAFGGMMVSMQMGDEPEALREARTARRQLDERTQERLAAALTESQRERLPKPGTEAVIAGGPVFQASETMIIRGSGGSR